MPTTVVIPLDTSSAAETALPFGLWLARRVNGTICLLSVIEIPFELGVWATGPDREHFDGLMREESARQQYLRSIGSRIGGIPIDTMVRVGDVPGQILAGVDPLEEPVIVVSSHGAGGFRRNLIGTVTTRIVHQANCPVIVVPASQHVSSSPHPTDLTRILVALDGSEHAERALDVALGLLGSRDLAVTLVYVIETAHWFDVDSDGVGYQNDLDAYIDVAHRNARDYLGATAEKLRSRGCRARWEIRTGHVDRQIDTVALDEQADMIVMSTHGRTGLRRVVIGSVAERVVRGTRLPVMLVPPRLSQTDPTNGD